MRRTKLFEYYTLGGRASLQLELQVRAGVSCEVKDPNAPTITSPYTTLFGRIEGLKH